MRRKDNDLLRAATKRAFLGRAKKPLAMAVAAAPREIAANAARRRFPQLAQAKP